MNNINSGNHGWTAAVPSKIASVEDVKTYLGAFLPGDAEYREESVMEIEVSNAELPTSLDSAEKWLQRTIVANVRDQSASGSCWACARVARFESRACVAIRKDIKYSPEVTAFC